MIVVRKFLDNVFTKKELQVLDDILPAFKRHERQDDEEALQQVSSLCIQYYLYTYIQSNKIL